MAYSEELARRIRFALAPRIQHTNEIKMMGGLAFMLHGKMCCGVMKDELMVRVVPDKFKAALEQPHCRVMDFTGKPMKGFVVVAAAGIADDKALESWLAYGIEFVERAAGIAD